MKKVFLGEGITLNLLGPLLGLFYCLVGVGPLSDYPIANIGLWFLIPTLLYYYRSQFDSSNSSAGLLSILLACSLSLFNASPFENDFYRYFFEGQAILQGENPYTAAPADLFHLVQFKEVFRVGHPTLTSLYPPLTLGLFSFFRFIGGDSLKLALLLYSLFNGALLWYLLFWLKKNSSDGIRTLIPLIMAVLLRESCFQYHFEIWAILPFLLAMNSSHRGVSILGFLTSFHLKLLGIFGIIHFLKNKKYNDLLIFVAFLGLSLLGLYNLTFFESSGLQAFSSKWLFAPGFLNILLVSPIRHIDFSILKTISFVTGASVVIFGLLHKGRDPRLALVFSLWTFFYFSPVYNAWYALWPGVLLCSLLDKRGAYCLLMSPLCYIYFAYRDPTVLFWANLIVHLPYFLFSYDFFKGNINVMNNS